MAEKDDWRAAHRKLKTILHAAQKGEADANQIREAKRMVDILFYNLNQRTKTIDVMGKFGAQIYNLSVGE